MVVCLDILPLASTVSPAPSKPSNASELGSPSPQDVAIIRINDVPCAIQARQRVRARQPIPAGCGAGLGAFNLFTLLNVLALRTLLTFGTFAEAEEIAHAVFTPLIVHCAHLRTLLIVLTCPRSAARAEAGESVLALLTSFNALTLCTVLMSLIGRSGAPPPTITVSPA